MMLFIIPQGLNVLGSQKTQIYTSSIAMKTETCLTKRPFLMAYGGLNMFNALSTNVGTVLAV